MSRKRWLLKHFSKQKVRFLLVNGFTLASLLLAMLAVAFVMAEWLPAAACCLLGCVALDGCDGNLARKWHVTSPFGAQLDSLADMTAFGVATGVLVYYWLGQKAPTLHIIAMLVGGLLALTSAIRLARFNVTPKNDAYFQGIPTTGAASIILLIYFTAPNLNTVWLLILIATIALLMVSAFPYFKFTQLRRVPPWAGLLVLISSVINLSATTLILALLYLSSGPFLWIKARRAGV